MSDTDYLSSALDKVSDLVDDALNSKNFQDLGESVGRAVKSATDGAKGAVRGFAEGFAGNEERQDAGRPALNINDYFAPEKSSIGPKIAAVIGAAGAFLFGLTTIGAVLAAFHGGSIMVATAITAGVITACNVMVVLWGFRKAKRTDRYNAYRRMLFPRLYMNVSEIAKNVGISEEETVRELGNWIADGSIRQGHFDENRTCIIASDELYAQYQTLARRETEEKKKQYAREQAESAIAPEVRDMLDKGHAFLAELDSADDKIRDESVRGNVLRMEEVIRKILEEVQKRPELAPKLAMFMTYYLPTSVKLVKAYADMENQPVRGDNIVTSQKEIADSLGTINDAYENLLDSFFADTAVDVASDISVMKTMMKQQGLTEDDLSAVGRAGRDAAEHQIAAH